MTGPEGGTSSSFDGGDPPAPRDPITELDRGLPRIGTPVHLVMYGNPSGAPCVPAVYAGFDGHDALVTPVFGANVVRAEYVMPGMGQGPVFTYGTFHLAARCEVTGPVEPAQQVRMDDGKTASTDTFRVRGEGGT